MLIKKAKHAIFLFFIIFIFGGYFAYQLKNYFGGPKIILNNLNEWNMTNSDFIEIAGSAKNVSNFFLNGRKIFWNEKGYFKENLVLAPGLNIMQIRADDKFGHKKEEYYYIIYSRDGR